MLAADHRRKKPRAIPRPGSAADVEAKKRAEGGVGVAVATLFATRRTAIGTGAA